ncbi:hypothetical protein HMF8227_01928 [Saliniradius amylolyticus]|uniref:DUF7939 domain-containing protein n=2 Tax=Saliniradius amylolyticus TaxID=2183582 RepID=A0A2S2E414_9ALTE|nr:hypothetical protein HMF8227_01928 [Saliniradius amylolyticus]
MASSVQADVTEVVARVDKNPAMLDEGITLEVIVDDSVDSDAFDPSPLLKDFVVGKVSTSKQTSIVNGSLSQTTRWSTRIIAREPGQYRIPAFDIEGKRTQPIELMVLPRSEAPAAQGRDVFLTTEVDLKQVYLQQQVHYKVRLHLAADLQRGSLSAPELENADIRQIGEDSETNEIVNGRRYRIIERNFAIIPQASGSFTIKAPVFEGEVVKGSHRSFAGFNTTEAVTRIGEPVDIQVLPQPDDFQGQWLPSDFVELRQEWQPADGKYTVGEPITRTLTLTAFGAVEEQLPKITADYPQDVKTYPDANSSTTVEKDDRLVAQRTDSVAIVPTRAGTITLPEVSVPWFNVVTGQTEYATLPEKTIEVAPAKQSGNAPLPQQSTDNQATQQPATPRPPVSSVTSDLWFYTSVVLAVLWLLTLTLWWRHASREPAPKGQDSSFDALEATTWKRLQSSLKQQNAKDSLETLGHWLSHHTGRSGSLNDKLEAINDPALYAAVNQLVAAAYGRNTEAFDGAGLKDLLQKHRRQANGQASSTTSLPSLQQIQ